MSTVQRVCLHCKEPFFARSADVKRGWAKFCSKSCKAVKQEQRTGQYREYQDRMEGGDFGLPMFDNAHQFDNTEL